MRLPSRHWLNVLCLLGGGVVFTLPISAGPNDKQVRDLLQQAQNHEQNADWARACEIYEDILRQDRHTPGVQARYQHSLRRYWQSRRHKDESFRKEVLTLDYGQALRLYCMVRDTLLDNSLDKRKVDSAALFRRGLEELGHALADREFCRQYVPPAKHGNIRNFREYLTKTMSSANPATRAEAAKQVREIALAAQNVLQLSSTVALMEFTCGACYALDDYTVYLTPHQLRELCESLRGDMAGVGLTFRVQDGKLVIDEIEAGSPAADFAMPKLASGDPVISIDKNPASMLRPEQAQEMLQGPLGSTVDLEIFKTEMSMQFPISLQRRSPTMPSVTYSLVNSIGYVRITSFQDSTVQDVDAALAALTKADMKALILDLHGNTGGVFDSAIEVARRFIANGVIATMSSTQLSEPALNKVYHARNPNALTIPLVVVIDGETASASEVLVGALKAHKRARLVGQTTFGKGCTQFVLKLPPAAGNVPTGGLRLTVARYFAPDGFSYTGRGIVPDRFASADEQLASAFAEIDRMLRKE